MSLRYLFDGFAASRSVQRVEMSVMECGDESVECNEGVERGVLSVLEVGREGI